MEVEADELALRRQRSAALKCLLATVQGSMHAPDRTHGGKKGKGAGAAAVASQVCSATGVLEESDLLQKSGLHGVSATLSAGGGAEARGSFDADVVEEIVSEMLEDAARLKEEGAARAVKKRALVSWLEELVGLGLSGHASVVPVARKSLDSLLEGAVDVGRVLPHSFQLPMRMPGTKKKLVVGKQPPQQSAGDYFMRNVALLGRLREAATSARNMDLSAGEVNKGMGMCEHAVYLTALQREHLAAFSIELIRLHHLATNAAHLMAPVTGTSEPTSDTAGGAAGIPPQTAARGKLEGTCGLLRDASLQLQQIHALHSGACAAARADYLAATGNAALIAHLSQSIDKIHAELQPHNLSSPDGIDAVDTQPNAAEEAPAAAAAAEKGAGDKTWTLVSWCAVRAADQALSAVLALCEHAKASSNSTAAGMDAVSRALLQWVERVTHQVQAQQGLRACVKIEPISSEHVQALSAALQEHMDLAGKEALAVTQHLRVELVADSEAAAVAADEPEADSGDEDEDAEGWGMRVVDRHDKVLQLLAWERLQRVNTHLASAQHLLARLSDVAASGPGVKPAAGARAPKGSAPGGGASEAAQAQLAAMTDQLYRVGAVVGMLAFVGEEATVRATSFHRSCCKLSMVLLGVLTELLANGFCRKPEEAEEGDDIEGVEGMGMGEGEGEKNVSDQIEDEEQLTGAEQEGQQKKDEGSEQKREEGEEAVEMEQDFDGELDDVDKEQEKEEDDEGEDEDKEEVEREMGEVGSDEEQVLDERQGDDDLDEDEDKQDDKYEKDNPLKGDEDKMDKEMRGKDDDDQNTGEDDKKDEQEDQKNEQKNEDGKDGEAEEEEMGSEDEEDEGEKGKDEVEDSHGMDAQAEEGHKLPDEEDELPEDMALDEQEGGADGEDKEEQEGEGEDEKEEEGEGQEDAMEEDAVEHEEAKAPEVEQGEEGHEEDRAQDAQELPDDGPGDDADPDRAMDLGDEEKEPPAAQDTSEQGGRSTEGEQRQGGVGGPQAKPDKMQPQENQNNSAAPKAQAGPKGKEEGQEEQGEEDGDGEEEAAEERQKSRKRADANPFRSLAEEVEEELKREARDKKEQGEGAGEEQDKDMDDASGAKDADMHEYVKENEKADAVAAGAATEEQRAQQAEKEGEEPKDGKDAEEAGGEEGAEDDEKGDGGKDGGDEEEEEEGEDGNEDKRWRFSKSSAPKTVAPAEKEDKAEEEEEMVEGGEEVARSEEEEEARRRDDAARQALLDGQQAIATNVDQLAKQEASMAAGAPDDMQVDRAQDADVGEEAEAVRQQSAAEIEAALKLWGVMEQRTSAQARELCEQLRLVLEPTLASKLKGDFKSGKRINLKKIIPFIASQFKRDKIWMRRTAPVKRTYQVLIAVDNSQSMLAAADYAREALAMIWKALAQLEVGDVGVIQFGDTHGAKVVHSLDQPLSDDAGARVLSGFSFDESGGKGVPKTAAAGPFETMLKTSLDSLREAKGSRSWHANTETLQLLLIVSDGRILGGRQQVQRLVREAAEEGVLPVLVLLDCFASSGAGPAGPANANSGVRARESILEEKSLRYVNGKPKLFPFLDDYPLPYYILLRDMHALPSYLGDALRQWFELVAGQGSK